jgi:16S rRNA A1518/A1519 N6-dimethyltransferase RsmA/KsgA/DIM1 with predicted DNA glycosylase/AP lyase activity
MPNPYDVPLILHNDNPMTAILSYVSPHTDILEMGPAAGRLTRYLSETMNCRVSIVEIDVDLYEKARRLPRTASAQTWTAVAGRAFCRT